METDNKILFYEGRYYMFSNFSSFQVNWRGLNFMTSEHAYQAEKFVAVPAICEMIISSRSAHDAKKLAKHYKDQRRSDWDQVKLGIMEEIVRAKHAQHTFIQERLLETKGKILVEDSPKDSFWGRGPDWKGENHLGKIWMKIRDEELEKLKVETLVDRVREQYHGERKLA